MAALFAALAAGLIAYYQQHKTNQTNVKLAREAQRASQASADKQMRFQENMANTSIRRQKADYEAAGFNPLLALGSGADTPSGSSAQMQPAQIDNPLPASFSSAKQSGMAALEYNQGKASLDYTKSLTNKANVEAAVAKRGLPEADLKNELYKWGKQKFDEGASSAKQIREEFLNQDPKRKSKPITIKPRH